METNSKRVLYFKCERPARALAEACLSLTPKVSVTEDGREIFLELEDADGIISLARRLAENFNETPLVLLLDRAEWARSCAVLPEVFLPPGEDAAFLHSLPIDRLEFIGDPATTEVERAGRRVLIARMRRAGLRTIGDFAQMSYISVGRNYGEAGIELQEWVGGVRELTLPDFVPSDAIVEKLETDEIPSHEALLFTLPALLARIENRLVGRSLVARQFKAAFTLASGDRLEKFLELPHAGSDATPLLKLLRDFLSSMYWQSPLARIEIEVTRAIEKGCQSGGFNFADRATPPLSFILTR